MTSQLLAYPRALFRITHLLNDLHLAVEAGGTALNEGHISRETHLVHMATRLQIVQRIEYDLKRLEPCNVELGVLDVVMVRLNLDVRVEPAR